MSDSIVKKIKALIDKANSTDSLPEAEAFMAKAQELLQKYNIEMSQVKNLESEDSAITEIEMMFTEQYERHLMKAVFQSNFCTCILLYKEDGFILIGKNSNIQVSKDLYLFFRNKIQQLSVFTYNQHIESKKKELSMQGIDWNKLSKKAKKSFEDNYIFDYLTGAVDGVVEKLRQQKEIATRNDAHLRSLVLVNDSQVSVYVRDKYPSLSKVRVKEQRHSGGIGYARGFSDGKNIGKNQIS